MKKVLLINSLIFVFCFVSVSSFSQAQQKIDSLQTLLRQSIADTTKVNTYNYLAWELQYKHPDSAFSLARRSLRLAEKLSYNKGIAGAYHALGSLNDNRTDYQNALDYYYKALEIRSDLGDQPGLASNYTNIGSVYWHQGNYSRALEYYLEGLKISEEIGSEYNIASSSGNIGVIYQMQENYPKALEYHLKALEINEKLGDKVNAVINLGNIGSAYVGEGNFTKALEYNFKALEVDNLLRNDYGISRHLGNIGAIYYFQGDSARLADDVQKAVDKYLEAMEYLFKALKMDEGIGKKRGMARHLGNIGALYIELSAMGKKKYSEAEEYLQRSLTLAMEIGALSGIEFAHKNYSRLYESTGQFQKSLEHYKLYAETKDSLLNEESFRQINEMQIKYETEKKEKEIELLSSKNEIQELQLSKNRYLIFGLVGIVLLGTVIAVLFIRQNKLQARQKEIVLEQKLLRAQMNPHFIFNSLNSIQRLILESNNEDAYEYLEKFSSLMRRILEHSGQSTISLGDEIELLKLYLDLEALRFEDKFEYKIDIPPGLDLADARIPIMIVQPHVENAIRHGLLSKKSRGEIQIDMKQKNGLLMCTVQDNGVGRKKAMEIKQKSHPMHKSMGTSITEERLKHLNSKKGNPFSVNIEDLEDDAGNPLGTKVNLSIPLNYDY